MIDKRHSPLLISVLIVLAGKIFMLLEFGDLRLGDNARLLAFADAILTDSEWLVTANIDREAIPSTLWKPVGYPLIVAASRSIAGESWHWMVLVGQGLVSFCAGLALYRLGRVVGLGALGAAAVFVFYEWSLPFSTDALLMPDAFYGGLMTLFLAIMLARWLEGRRLGPGASLLYGLGFALCFLIREVFQYVTPLAALLVLAMSQRDRSWPKAAGVALCFLLPSVVAIAGISAWNQARTGYALVTSGGQTAFLVAIVETARIEPRVLEGPGPIETVARKSLVRYDYGEAQVINQRLFDEYGLTAPEQSRLMWRKYFETLRDFPIAFIQTFLSRLRIVSQGTMFSGPLVRYDDMVWWRGGAVTEAYYLGWRGEVRAFRETYDWRVLSTEAIVLGIPRAIARLVGVVMLVGYAVLVPAFVLWGAGAPVNVRLVIGGTWLLYFAVVGVHLFIFLEMRYLSGVIGFAILGLFVSAQALLLPKWRNLCLRVRQGP